MVQPRLTVRFQVLGPLAAHVRDQEIAVERPRRRAVLAYLLLSANRIVPIGELVEAVWGGVAPATARAQIQAEVYGIRQVFRLRELPDPIGTVQGGYRINAGPGQLDLGEFVQSLAGARRASEVGEPRTAARLLRDALALWQGPALAGLRGAYVEAARTGLEERRLAAHEELADIDLSLGRETEVAAELGVLVKAYPLRERLRGQLMVALYRNGRPAEALALVHDLRRTLADQYGLDPGPQIRRIESLILRNDPALQDDGPARHAPADASGGQRSTRASPGPVRVTGPPVTGLTVTEPPVTGPDPLPAPAELPAAVPDFVGRDDQVARLDGLLPDAPAAALTTLVIAGPGGVGKTALAVWWLHRVAHLFPDGQLFVNLQGYGPGPRLRPVDALARILRALRVPEERIPIGQDESAALYRSLLAGRRSLILLDNAADAEQVVPLLPGSPRCLVVVTSRDRLGALVAIQGARRLTLDVLDRPAARALLGAVLGAERVAAEPEACDELIRLCGHLPLALRIAAAHLDEQPGTVIAGYVTALAAAGPLASLAIEEAPQVAVRAVLDASYARLTADERRMFGLLDLVPGPDVTAEAAAALARWPLSRAEGVLDRLAAAHLLSCTGSRYMMHDLVRDYCAERAAVELPGDGRATALDRLLGWYLRMSDAAARVLYPQILRLEPPPPPTGLPPVDLDSHLDAGRWLSAELPNLLAAIESSGPRPVAWLLADALRGYFWQSRRTLEWQRAARAGLAAATLGDDPAAQVAGQLSLGQLSYCLRLYPQAVEHYTAALELGRGLGWLPAQATILSNRASVYADSGRPVQAMDDLEAALAVNRTSGWRPGEAITLGNLGLLAAMLGRLHEAERHYVRALRLHRENGSHASAAVTLGNLADIEIQTDRLEAASRHVGEALELARTFGRLDAETLALIHLAEIDAVTGDLAALVRHATAAVRLIGTGNDRDIEALAHNALGDALARCGELPAAAEEHAQARRLCLDSGNRYVEIEALLGLATCQRQQGDLAAAETDARRALAESQTIGYRVLEARALTVLAAVRLDDGDPDAAAGHARRALDIHRQTGGRLGEKGVHAVIAQLGGTAAAVPAR